MKRQRSRQKLKRNVKIEKDSTKRQPNQTDAYEKKQNNHKNHKFIWSDSDDNSQQPNHYQSLAFDQNYQQKISLKQAKQQYKQLYKEFVIIDLSRYQTGQIGCRWRTQKEVISDKGEKYCGSTQCDLLSEFIFEMNFGYYEEQIKKNALVKVCVCKGCAEKLNHKKKLKLIEEIKLRLKVKLQENQQSEKVLKSELNG